MLSAKKDDSRQSSDDSEFAEQPTSQHFSMLKGRKLTFDYGGFPFRDISIHDASSNTDEYFVDISRLTSSSPDIVLRSRGRDGAVAGQTRFGLSRSIQCGIGSNDLAMDWVEIKSTGVLQVKYQFQYAGRTFTLSRTRDAELGVDGMNRISRTHYKIVDEASGEVVAYYNSQSGPGKRRGVLTLTDAVATDLEVVIILTVTSIREKTKRRARFAAGGGAGG